jgi:uncharacterized membrane protein
MSGATTSVDDGDERVGETARLSSNTAEGCSRLLGVDSLKGVLMVVMALDHAKRECVDSMVDPVPLEWYYEKAAYDGPLSWWMTRFVTHFVAVGFVLCLGIGLFFWVSSRSRMGWTTFQILRYVVFFSRVVSLFV